MKQPLSLNKEPLERTFEIIVKTADDNGKNVQARVLLESMSNTDSLKQKYLAACNLSPLIWVNNLICINHQLNGWAKENYHTLTIRNLYPNLIIQC